MIIVPEKTIAAIPFHESYRGRQNDVFLPLVGLSKRDWFSKHAYFCLPLVIGNQYGFAVKSLYDFNIFWHGGDDFEDCEVEILNKEDSKKHPHMQKIVSHFGSGIITIQTAFTLRSPPNVNLITMNPPNAPIDGISNLTGVIETDNLRRDFTFNLKVTRPNYQIKIKKGTLLSAFLPYPRDYFENYELKDAYELFSDEEIKEEQECMRDFGREREEDDPKKPNGNGRRYFKGIDIYNNVFRFLHQKNLFKKGKKENKDLQDD